ncbi:MAG: DUF1643 domain-containing protein [Pseudomonadota bacterium]
MKTIKHSDDNRSSVAKYSDCGHYRYALTRVWEPGGPIVNFVMLNPSVADAEKNDPTVERCERRARRMGFAGFSVTNIFAWRDTDPFKMRKARHPIGPENDRILLDSAAQADIVIAAWGAHGAHLNRGPAVHQLFVANAIDLHHLGLTKQHHPRHPLYVPYDRLPRPWATAAG